MTKSVNAELTTEQHEELLNVLNERFEKHMERHETIQWDKVRTKLESAAGKLWSLHEMERTGGEPDVVAYDEAADVYTFMDCAPESPSGRRSLCYDQKALEARKKNKPENSSLNMAEAMGIEMLTEEQYRALQALGNFDMKTSSWVQTPVDVRDRGGAFFCDFRYGRVFLYHNGADSYYAARGFRGALKV